VERREPPSKKKLTKIANTCTLHYNRSFEKHNNSRNLIFHITPDHFDISNFKFLTSSLGNFSEAISFLEESLFFLFGSFSCSQLQLMSISVSSLLAPLEKLRGSGAQPIQLFPLQRKAPSSYAEFQHFFS